MRAAIDLPQPIFDALRARAEQQGSTVQAVVIEAIEKEIARSPVQSKAGHRVVLPLIHSGRPGSLRSMLNVEVDDLLD